MILDSYSLRDLTPDDEDNVITAIQYPNRVCSVRLGVTGLQLERMVTLMQEPFPMLTYLTFVVLEDAPVIPAEFLGGSAPCLQGITLSGISFPALPTLLFSTSNVIDLSLENIPPAGYISPDTMGACLAALPRLESVTIWFLSATPHPGQIRLPPVTRTVLPSLTSFDFQGANEWRTSFTRRMALN